MLAHRSIPDPSGVLCFNRSFSLMLLYRHLLKGKRIGGFFSLYIPVSIIAYASIFYVLTCSRILSSLDRLLRPYGTPLIFYMRKVTYELSWCSGSFHSLYVIYPLSGRVCLVFRSMCIIFLDVGPSIICGAPAEPPIVVGTTSIVSPWTSLRG